MQAQFMIAYQLYHLLFNQKKFVMAEIHVQAKKRSSNAWLWILISIIVIAALAFVLIWNNNNADNPVSKPNPTSFIQYEASPSA